MTADDAPVVEQDQPGAKAQQRGHAVGDEEHRAAGGADLGHAAEAFLLELRVADGQYLVHQEDVGLEVCRHREGQPQVHARRVPLDRRVQETLDSSKINDLVKLANDLRPPHAQDRSGQEDILPAGQLGMESRPHLQQRAHPAPDLRMALGRRGDPGEDLE